MKYEHKKIEEKWRAKWVKENLYKTAEGEEKEKYYVLDMFPYPSGDGLHVGHPRGYIATDVFARLKMLQGYNVLHPMGWDAFGLPAENYALKNKTHPRESTQKNIDTFKSQMEKIGFTYDWEREINTTDPEFYKWTQWIFLKMFEHGLAYESFEPINWCPDCQTGLANEDLEGGKCERCGSEVEQKPMRQWVLKITDYADRLLDDIDKLRDWDESIKEMQKNWIGRSEGAKVSFEFRVSNFESSQKLKDNNYFKFRTNLIEKIFNGEKWVTFRMEPKDIKEGEVIDLIDWAEGNKDKQEVVAQAEVTKTKEVAVKDLDLNYPGHESYNSLDEFKEETSKFYDKKIKDDDIVYIYEFELISQQIDVFTTRPDTLFGATYFVIAPEHPLVKNYEARIKNYKEVNKYINKAKKKTELERTDLAKEKTGVRLEGVVAVNPVNGEELPVFVADYVMMHYGTGAIMAVPAHDERDWEFARTMNQESRIKNEEKIKIKPVVVPQGGEEKEKVLDKKECFAGKGVNVNSDFLDGLETGEAKEKMTKWLEKNNLGKKDVNYKLKDWVFSRQRYWGEPIPIVHCEKCGAVPVPEKDLPLKLPEVDHYEPTGTGESPLAGITDWVNTTCPKCGGEARRETNTMPQWAGSSWYYLRFIDPHNDKVLVDKDKEKYWSPVDFYVGGAEHATRHLIYARFWHKFLYDIGAVNYDEPFKRLQHVGIILAEDGRKMSKRWGNVINPDDIVEQYGADALRLYEMFMGPFSQSIAWSTNGLVGVRKFLDKVYLLSDKVVSEEDNKEIISLLHKTIKKVGEDIESFKLNTAVSALMILVNKIFEQSQEKISQESYESLLKILSPFAPHLSEELWEKLGKKESVFTESWPEFDSGLARDKTIELVIQVNGKLRDKFEVEAGIEEEEAKQKALEREKIKEWTKGKEIIKVIFVPGKLVNIVVE